MMYTIKNRGKKKLRFIRSLGMGSLPIWETQNVHFEQFLSILKNEIYT